jgi:hypothetical protein
MVVRSNKNRRVYGDVTAGKPRFMPPLTKIVEDTFRGHSGIQVRRNTLLALHPRHVIQQKALIFDMITLVMAVGFRKLQHTCSWLLGSFTPWQRWRFSDVVLSLRITYLLMG